MDWMNTIGSTWLHTLGWLAGLTVVFGIAVRLMPCNPGMYWWRDLRAVATDFVYWFIVPLFVTECRLIMLILGVAFLFAGQDPDLLPVRKWPLWQQCVLILLVQDVFLYWSHRLFHTRLGWGVHSIHHSPKVLDWMSTSRFHPLNLVFSGTSADVLVLLLGFDPAALLVLVPINLAYSTMVHANLNWTFGPLKYVFASPVFHRWHHTTEEEGLDKNFASTFPILDLVFGTFYMPPGRLPERFGNGDPDFPQGFMGQLVHPFRLANLPTLGVGRALRWARGRPISASLLGASGTAAGCLVVVGLCFTVHLADRNKQLSKEVALAKRQQSWAEQARHAMQLDLAQRALMDNDLVRATAILDDVASPFQEVPEQQHLRDLCRRKCLVLAGHLRTVTSVAICADGQRIVSGSEDGTVKVWDCLTGQEKYTLKGHTKPVRCVAISADGRRIVSASYDQTIRVWDGHTSQQELALEGHTGAVLSVAISADGKRIVSGGADMTARIWDATTGKLLFTLPGHIGAVLSVAISADGKRIVSASWATPILWDGETGRKKLTLKGHTDLVYSVAISNDGERIVSGSFDETVKVWDALTGQALRSLKGHNGPIFSVAIGKDGKMIASGGRDMTVRVWDAESGQQKLLLKGHTDSVTSVAVSRDGRRILSGSVDRTMKLWDSRSCTYLDKVDLTRRD